MSGRLGNGTAVVCQPVLHYQVEMDIPWRKQWSGVDPQWYLWLERGGCGDDDLVLVHDAVRPLLSQDIISSNIAICQKYGYAITGIKCREAILESEDGFTTNTSIPRDKLIRTQTPQTFRLGNLIAAHEEAKEKGIANSVASCTLMAELGGRQMHIVPGSEKNIKITTVEDLEILKALMKVQPEAWLK